MKNRLSILFSLLMISATLLSACGSGQPETPTAIPTAVPTATPAGDPVAGKDAYLKTCIACHGPEGKGVTGLGKDLTTSEFVSSKTDAELVAFLKTGRPSTDPLNTTKVDMPPKGGNPALTDQDLLNIVAFLRSIHQ